MHLARRLLSGSLYVSLTLPLSWSLMHHVTMRTTVDVRASWDQGYATVYQYGFPLPFTHWGLASSAEYSHFLGPLLLDWGVYFLVLAAIVGVLTRGRSMPRMPVFLGVIIWGWALWTTFFVVLDAGIGGVHWTTRHPVLMTQDPVISWGYRGGGMDGYGPRE